MGQFDNRFSMLLKSPLIEDPNKSLRQPEIPISSHLLDPVLPVGKPKGRGKLIVKPAYVVTSIKGSIVFSMHLFYVPFTKLLFTKLYIYIEQLKLYLGRAPDRGSFCVFDA